MAIWIDNRQHEQQLERNTQQPQGGQTLRGQAPKDPNAMDIDMVMLRQQQRKRLSPQDLKRYWDKNLCFGCGQESYRRTDCFQKGSQKKKKILAAVQEVQEDQKELLGKDRNLEVNRAPP